MNFEINSNYITNVLNELLDKTHDNEMFEILGNMHYSQVEQLLEVINFPRSKEILTKIFPIFLKKPAADIAFGCRKPNTLPGSAYGAFVYVQNGPEKVFAIFEHGKDFIGHPKNIYEAVKIYDNYMKTYKAIPMSIEDMMSTSGIVVDNETKLNPPQVRRRFLPIRMATFIFIGLATIPILHFVRF